MASIKGITIEIGGNTSQLQDSLKNVNKIIQSSNKELKELERALKLDPSNTQLLAQKQQLLKKNIEETTEKLSKLKVAQQQMGSYNSLTEEQQRQYRALSIEISKSEVALKRMNNQLDSGKSADFSKTSDSLKKVGDTALKVGDIIKANLATEAIVRGFDSVVNKIKSVTSAISGMVVSGGINRALNLENAKAKLSTFTKSTEQLDEIMKNVSDSVDGTAFSMDAAATVASGLFAAGVKEGDQMTKSLKLVADAAQVSGRPLEEIGAIFNKIAANGKISGEELNQLSDSGIPILQMLAEATGKSTEEVRDLVSAGKVGFSEFSDAMEKGLGGAAQKAGSTFTSSLANLKSSLSRVGAELMTPILEGLTPVMNTTKDMIKNMVNGEDISDQMNKLLSELDVFVKNAADHLTSMIDKYLPVINQLITGIVQMIPELLPQFIPVLTNLFMNLATIILDNLPLIIESVVEAIVLIAQSLAENLPVLLPKIIDCVLKIADVLVENIDVIIDAGLQLLVGLIQGLTEPETIQKLMEKLPQILFAINTAIIRNLPIIIAAGGQILLALGQGILAYVGKVGDWIQQIIDKIKQKFSEVIDKAKSWGKDMIQGFIDGINSFKNKVGDAAKGIADKIKNFLHFSRPDVGPLRNYETWMPDMIQGLTKGIKDSSYMLENATLGIADQMRQNLQFNDIFDNTSQALRGLNYGINNSSNPIINPNAYRLMLNNNQSNNNQNPSGQGFTAIINNNSKYTSPSENARLLRQEYELYKLKYGGV